MAKYNSTGRNSGYQILSTDKSAPSNLPKDVKYVPYAKEGQYTGEIGDELNRIEEQCSSDGRSLKKQIKPRKA